MNKHGFTGIRKRCSPQHWRKPYYARISLGCEKFAYSKNVATAEEAAAEYARLKAGRAVALSSTVSNTPEGK